MTTEELESFVSRHKIRQREQDNSCGAESVKTARALANAYGGFIVIGCDNRGNPTKLPATAKKPSVTVGAEYLELFTDSRTRNVTQQEPV